MKRDKIKVRLKASAAKTKSRVGDWGGEKMVFAVIFGAILISTIGLKIYKADHTGIIYDEAMTQQHFGLDVNKALHPASIANKYVPLTNNHVLNSVFIYYAQKLPGTYEHNIRIPSLGAGIVFSLALAYIIYKTIRSYILGAASLALISLSPFVFDYSFLARGYAFGLAAIFTEIALLLWWLDHKIKLHRAPILVLLIAGLNFLAIGATLSSLFFLAALNLTFVLFYSWKVFRDPPNKLRVIIFTGLSIFLVSFAAAFLLYHGMYEDIINDAAYKDVSGRWDGWSSFTDLFYNLFLSRVFRSSDAVGVIIPVALAALVAGGIVLYVYKFRAAVRRGAGRKYLQQDDRVFFVFMITGLSIMFLFLYGVILKRSLGFERNNVFLIPMVLICISIILDRFAGSLTKRNLDRLVSIAGAGLMLALILHNPVSPYFVYDNPASISGPLLRKLNAIDPDRTWNIALTNQTRLFPMSFLYYRQFGYKFNDFEEVKQPEVTVCRLKEKSPKAFCLEYENFSKSKCAVVLENAFPFDRIVLDVRLKEN